ncbi:hypothetical protein BDN71DRAFT_1404731, partial [Pleurotus eryngii]
LRFPYVAGYIPNDEFRTRIASYLKQVIGGDINKMKKNLPCTMPLWGKLRIRHGGDSISTTACMTRQNPIQRNKTFIRCEFSYEDDTRKTVDLVQYGQLQKIVVCQLDNKSIWKHLQGETLVLALVKPCQTRGLDGRIALTSYSTFLAGNVIDLRSIKAVVGRVESRGKWYIIDRSENIAPTAFHEQMDSDEDE